MKTGLKQKIQEPFEAQPDSILTKLRKWTHVKYTNSATYTGEFVAVDNTEHFPIEGDVHTVVDVFPVPVVATIVLWQTLPLDQLSYQRQTDMTTV